MKRVALGLTSPYVGLRPFEERDTLVFFGRKRNVNELLTKLQQGPRFLAVLGASGTGKSSLVRAGLIPALHRGATTLPSTRRWNIVTVKPGNAPMANLVAGLAELGPVLGDFAADQTSHYLNARLQSSPLGLVEQFNSSADRHPDEALLVFVDQFEEVFRYRQQDVNEAEAFVKLLLRSAREPDVPIYVVITMRADFLDKAVAFKQLPEAINGGLYLTPRLDIEELRSVVTSPLRLVDGEIEPELVARLLNDLGGEDELPVLQHALLRMWNRARMDGRRDITMDDYVWICGLRATCDAEGRPTQARLQASIDNHATELFEQLEPAHQRTARNLFVALVAESEGRHVRREQPLAELQAHLGQGHEEEVRHVLGAYRADGVGFLLPQARLPLDQKAVIDIAHESLFRQWMMFQAWLKEEAEDVENLRYYHSRAWQHAQAGGGWLDAFDCPKALAWLDALSARGNADGWATRYLPVQPDALARIRNYVQHSRQELDTAADQARKTLERELATERRLRHAEALETLRLEDVARVKAVSARRLTFMSIVLALATVTAVIFALRAAKVGDDYKRAAALAQDNANTAARAAGAAASASALADQEKIKAINAGTEALRAAEAASAAAAISRVNERRAEIARDQAREEKLLSKTKDIWMPLQFLGDEREAAQTPIGLGLLNLARADLRTRQAFLGQVFSNEERAAKFNENPIDVLRAAAGLSPAMREWLGAETARLRKGPAPGPAVDRALVLANAYLGQPGFDAVLVELAGAERPARLRRLGVELVDLVRSNPAASTARWGPLTERLSSASSPGARSALALAIEAAAPHVEAARALPNAELLVAQLANAKSSTEIEALLKALAACNTMLDIGARSRLLNDIMTRLSATNSGSRESRNALAQAIGIATGKPMVRLNQAAEAMERLRAITKTTINGTELRSLGGAMGDLGQMLSESEANRMLPVLLSDFLAANDSDQVQAFVTGIEPTALRAAKPEAAAGVGMLVDNLVQSGGSKRGSADIAKVLAMLDDQLTPEQADALIERATTAQPGNRGSASLAPLFQVLLPRASETRALRAIDRLAEALGKSPTDWAQVSGAAEVLTGVNLPAARSRALVNQLISLLDPELDVANLRSATRALSVLANSLDAADASATLSDLALRSGELARLKDPSLLPDVALALFSRSRTPESARTAMGLVFADTTRPAASPADSASPFASILDSESLRLPLLQLIEGVENRSVPSLIRSVLPSASQSEYAVLRERTSDLVGTLPPDASALLHTKIFETLGAQALPSTRSAVLLSRALTTLATRPASLLSVDVGAALLAQYTRPSPQPMLRYITGNAFKAWAEQLKPGPVADAALVQLLKALEDLPPNDNPQLLGEALTLLLGKVPPASAAGRAAALLKTFEQPGSEARARRIAEAIPVLLREVRGKPAHDLLRNLLDMATRSTDAARIGMYGRMAAALARNLPGDTKSALVVVEFMKFPSTPLRELVQALGTDVGGMPPYGGGVPTFIAALERHYPNVGDLNAPAAAQQK